jgi:hypothetical protein
MEYHVLQASSVIALLCNLRTKSRTHDLQGRFSRNMAQTTFCVCREELTLSVCDQTTSEVVAFVGTWPKPYCADDAKLSWDERFASSAEYGLGHVPTEVTSDVVRPSPGSKTAGKCHDTGSLECVVLYQGLSRLE